MSIESSIREFIVTKEEGPMYHEHTWRVTIRRTSDGKSWVATLNLADYRVPETNEELKNIEGLVTEREELLTDPDKNRLMDRAFALLEVLVARR